MGNTIFMVCSEQGTSFHLPSGLAMITVAYGIGCTLAKSLKPGSVIKSLFLLLILPQVWSMNWAANCKMTPLMEKLY